MIAPDRVPPEAENRVATSAAEGKAASAVWIAATSVDRVEAVALNPAMVCSIAVISDSSSTLSALTR